MELKQHSIALELREYVAKHLVTENVNPATLEVEFQKLRESMAIAFSLKSKFWAEKLKEKKEVVTFHYSYPKNWFEHLKEQLLPQWMKHRWPVQMTHGIETKEVTFTPYAVYPQFAYSLPPDKNEVRFEVASSVEDL